MAAHESSEIPYVMSVLKDLVLRVGHGPVKGALFKLQIIKVELLHQHSS